MMREEKGKRPLFDRRKVSGATLRLFLLAIAATGAACVAGMIDGIAYQLSLEMARLMWMIFILSFAWLVIGIDAMKPSEK